MSFSAKFQGDSELEDLYRDVILDHFRNSSHPCDVSAQGVNPLCGDAVSLTLSLRKDQIQKVRFEGQGCVISQASSSILSATLEGKTTQEAQALVDSFKGMMLGNVQSQELPEDLEEAKVLEGVKKYPVRVKCALLSWNTLLEGLKSRRNGKGHADFTETTEAGGES